jgi:lipoprotein-anchoring transpeptidase ErfK/SrfK
MFKIILTLSALLIAGCTHKGVSDPVLNKRDAELVKKAPQHMLDPSYMKVRMPYKSKEKPGTIIIDTKEKFLYHVQANDEAVRYPVTVGAEAFEWSGEAIVQRKAEWPSWTPPAEMHKRWSGLPAHFAGGPNNPLGARGLYLYQNGRDTLFRIHGTNEPESIGQAVSSGCIRMLNMDVIHLYESVQLGTKVIVL